MYRLQCLACGNEYPDDGVMVRCPADHPPALLRTIYARTRFAPDLRATGIMRYSDWLPIRTQGGFDVARTAVFQSTSLNTMLRTPHLWLAFNGYWPARGALLPTGTFKDLETAAVLARFPSDRTLIAASAGNTAAALAHACSVHGTRTIIVVPESALAGVLARVNLASCVQIIGVPGDSTYDDAIAAAKALAASNASFVFEGGSSNVARRDGIGTTVLATVEAMGELPEYFVQAIGSGAGAIAAHEAALRLRADGRFGTTLPRLLLVQNSPSAPVYESWARGSRDLVSYGDDPSALRARLASLWSPVLSTQAPPYAIAGGLYDALHESRGDVCVADNAQAQAASALFESLEGVRIASASAVALAGLIGQLDAQSLRRDAHIVLHITGGDVRAKAGVSAA